MSNKFLQRFIFDLALFFAALHGWWFVALPVALLCAWRYAYYVEIVFAGMVYDSLFGRGTSSVFWSQVSTIFSTTVFVIALWSRGMVRK